LANSLHIITHDVPLPANYGGAIDAFYCIKNLHALGVDIILHCFEYGNRKAQSDLNKYCKQVYYYPRHNYWKYLFSSTPFIVASRMQAKLLENLCLDEHPILFFGLHTSGFLHHEKLKGRRLFVRTANVETQYYSQLEKIEKNYFKHTYLSVEQKRLSVFEKTHLNEAHLFVISTKDAEYFSKTSTVKIIPPFTIASTIQSKIGKGNYCMYHGNLAIVENHSMAMWLVNEVWKDLEIPLQIYGLNPNQALKESIANHKNISLVSNATEQQLAEAIENAHIHVLPSAQESGVKLKLMRALQEGRFVVANNKMLYGTEWSACCKIAESKEDWISTIQELMNQEFSDKEIELRKKYIGEPKENAQQMIKAIFGS
jgi:hypothetical protein